MKRPDTMDSSRSETSRIFDSVDTLKEEKENPKAAAAAAAATSNISTNAPYAAAKTGDDDSSRLLQPSSLMARRQYLLQPSAPSAGTIGATGSSTTGATSTMSNPAPLTTRRTMAISSSSRPAPPPPPPRPSPTPLPVVPAAGALCAQPQQESRHYQEGVSPPTTAMIVADIVDTIVDDAWFMLSLKNHCINDFIIPPPSSRNGSGGGTDTSGKNINSTSSKWRLQKRVEFNASM